MIRLGTKGRYIQINVTVCIYLHTMYRYLSVSTYIRCICMYLPFVYVWERQKVLQNRIVNQIMFSWCNYVQLMHSCVLVGRYILIHTHTYMRVHARTITHTHTQTTKTYIHVHAHTITHTHTHKPQHTHTHTQTTKIVRYTNMNSNIDNASTQT